MPLIAVVGAVTGASALAAGGLTVFQTVAAIGGIVSGIGAVTGNESLLKIGGIAGLAGGVGAFAQGKGWLASGSAANTAADAATSSSNIQKLTQTAAPGVESAAQNLGQATNAAELGTAGLEQTSQLAQNITSTNRLADVGNGLFDSAGSLTDAGIVGSPLTAGPGAASAPLPTGSGGWVKSLGTTELGAGARNMSFNAGAGGGGIFDMLKGFGDFMKDNKELTSLAGNFIGGMFDEGKKAKAEADRAYADAIKQKMANASAIPNMGFKLKQDGPIWKPTSPTYNGPRPSGLFYAR